MSKRSGGLPKAVRAILPGPARTIFLDNLGPVEAADAGAFKAAWAAVYAAGWRPGDDGALVRDAAANPAAIKAKMMKAGHSANCDACKTGDPADCNCPMSKKTADAVEINLCDAIQIDDGARAHITSDGYLVAYPRVARTGIQLYQGDEMGLTGADADKTFKVYRPESEVFSKDSLAAYPHKPVTNGHPPVLVDSANWAKFAVGNIGDEILRDGEFIRVPMILMDQKAINDVKSGRSELSMGYTMELRWDPGTTPTGEAYDAIQTRIRPNHLAVVDAARGGPQLRIGDDTHTQEPKMTTKQIMVDGLKVTLDERDAEIVQRAVDAATKALADAQTQIAALQTQTAKDKTEIAAKDAEIATLKVQLKDAEVTPAKLDSMVKDRQVVVAKAKALSPNVIVDGMTTAQIKKQVVDAKLGTVSKDWTSAQVDASFDSFAASAPANDWQQNPLNRAIGNTTTIHSSQDARDAAYAAMVQRDEQAWKGGSQTKQ